MLPTDVIHAYMHLFKCAALASDLNGQERERSNIFDFIISQERAVGRRVGFNQQNRDIKHVLERAMRPKENRPRYLSQAHIPLYLSL